MFNLKKGTCNFNSNFTGSGKTYLTADHLSQSSKPFIFAVPTLDQIDEVKDHYIKACKRNNTKQHNLLVLDGKAFNANDKTDNSYITVGEGEEEQPLLTQGKTAELVKALKRGDSIICSHTAFLGVDDKDLDLLVEYIVVMDEVTNLLRPVSMTKTMFELLERAGAIAVDPVTGKVVWTHIIDAEQATADRFGSDVHPYLIKLMCEGRLYKSQQFLIEELPHKVFLKADEVLVLAYMFEATYMHHHFNALGLPLNDVTEQYQAKSLYTVEELKAKAKERLVVKVSRKQPLTKLSVDSLTKATETSLSKISTAINSLRRKSDIKLEDAIFTCPKSIVDSGKLKLGKATWLYSGSRGVEKYSKKTAVLYLMEKNMNPAINARINQLAPTTFNKSVSDAFALQEMIQFIWRSNIRVADSDKPVTVYFASHRMAKIFNDWLNA
ncbi:hypothetical protein [Vibrio splendidus]|uniref:hypothetical protein n=1 Tax=Vibrio splendidus TaxID=29497 RepID=UPI000D3C80C4|nr:hypothetical protein [Vibrio splendidus]PTP95466.1 hypothetical protein CWO02_01085 [Vibrio splendidus]